MLDAQGIRNWVRKAKPGDAAVYARGDTISRTVAAAALQMQEQGLVDLTRRREPSGWQFLMQRRAKAFAKGKFMRRGRWYQGASAETVILRMIRDAIRLNAPCPTNAEFADAANLSGKVAASYRLRKLVHDGKITLTEYGPDERRVATLVETGQSTSRARL